MAKESNLFITFLKSFGCYIAFALILELGSSMFVSAPLLKEYVPLICALIFIASISLIISSTIMPEGCTKYKDEIGCTKCDKNYILRNNECFKAEGCFFKNDDGCTSCKMGYYLKDKLCYKEDKNCLSSKDNVGCVSCRIVW